MSGNTYSPQDDANTMYLPYSTNMQTLLELVQAKWPTADLDEVQICTQHIQTSCIGYDLYDSSDYTDYIVVTYNL